jgi:hypothetical protein
MVLLIILKDAAMRVRRSWSVFIRLPNRPCAALSIQSSRILRNEVVASEVFYFGFIIRLISSLIHFFGCLGVIIDNFLVDGSINLLLRIVLQQTLILLYLDIEFLQERYIIEVGLEGIF